MADAPEQLFDQAQAAHRAGDLATATALYQQIITHNNQHPDALHMLGVIAQQKGNAALALSLIEAALALVPNNAMAWNNRALILKTLGQKDKALQSVQHALSFDDGLPEAWETAGIIYLAQNDVPQALHHFQHASKLHPANLSITANLATTLLQIGDIAGALRLTPTLEKSRDPAHAVTIGNVLKASGHPARALPYYRKAIAALPQIGELRVNEATTLLQMGAWHDAWPIWETRKENPAPYSTIPIWDGNKIDHLLLYEDQGMGDALNMLRYIPLLEPLATRITLLTVPPLREFLTANFPDIQVTTELPSHADARFRLMSLPAFFNTVPATIPQQDILKTDPDLRAVWREKLAAVQYPRIGIIWAGNASNRKDHVRSVSFAELQPFLKTYAPHLVALQRDPDSESTSTLSQLGILNAAPHLHDFNNTAALIAELDLIISVDTAGAHLAGAIGKPVWLLNYFDPDFRWLLGRPDTPWYPSMRLYRQTTPHDWSTVLTAIAADCTQFIAGNETVLVSPKENGPSVTEDPHALKLPS